MENRSNKLWEIRETDPERERELIAALSLSPMMARLLVQRGFTDAETARRVLFPEMSQLYDPFLFKDMGAAVERVERAIESGEKILIYGDSDVDGVTSTALVLRYLERKTPHVSAIIPGNEGYGLQREKLGGFQAEGISLIISVDCGITNFEEAELLAKLGIDLIILDHHEIRERLPLATAIIDAKAPNCSYPFRNLAGVGTAMKFITACFMATLDDFPREFVAIDCETTGLDPMQAEMIELAAVRFRYGQPVSRFSSLIRPENPVPLEITGLTGITDGECRGAPELESVLDQWLDFCGDSTLVGHNIPFDLSFLKRYLKKTGRKKLKNKVIDTLTMSRSLLTGMPNHKLETISGRLGLSTESAHRAAADAEVAGRLLSHLLLKQYQSKIVKLINYFLDLVCLGTVADVVPLVDENRIFTKFGLERLRKSPSIGLRLLVERQRGDDQPITSRDIAWGIAPIINSAGRIGKGHISLDLLTTKNKSQAKEFVTDLRAINGEQKARVQKMFERFLSLMPEQVNMQDDRVICLMDGHHETGITGVVANKFLNMFGKPVFIITWNDDMAVGSARTATNIDLTHILEQCGSLLLQFGGHKRAAGFSMKRDNVVPFRDRLLHVVEEFIDARELMPRVTIDVVLRPEDLSLRLLDDLAFLEPCGEGIPAPLFAIEDVMPFEISNFGQEGRHLRLLLDAVDTTITAVYWNMGARAEELRHSMKPLDISFVIEKNVWRRRTELQLIVEDIRIRD